MSKLPKNNFQMVVSSKIKLRKHNLTDVIFHCSSENEFKEKIKENNLRNLILVCDNDTLINVGQVLLNIPNLHIIYVLSAEKDILCPFELIEHTNVQLVHVPDEKQLMIDLCLKAMYCYFEQGEKLKQDGDYGLANLCFLDSKKALKEAERMI